MQKLASTNIVLLHLFIYTSSNPLLTALDKRLRPRGNLAPPCSGGPPKKAPRVEAGKARRGADRRGLGFRRIRRPNFETTTGPGCSMKKARRAAPGARMRFTKLAGIPKVEKGGCIVRPAVQFAACFSNASRATCKNPKAHVGGDTFRGSRSISRLQVDAVNDRNRRYAPLRIAALDASIGRIPTLRCRLAHGSAPRQR